jgi:hypothetical protein
VLNGGKILRGPRFSLIFKRWTRCSHASSSIMSGLVDLEIRGIPVHAWALSTAKSILIDSCLIAEVHPDTLLKQDLSSFVVKVWCFNPEKLQRDSVLHIIEPGLQMFEKRCLTYKIQVSVLRASSSITPADPTSSVAGGKSPGDEDGNGTQDPHPRRPGGSQVQRRPLHLRLGPQSSSGRGNEAPAQSCASKEVAGDTGRDLHLTLGTDVSPTSEVRTLHLRQAPQPSLGRDIEAPAPPYASRENSGDTLRVMQLMPLTTEEPLHAEALPEASPHIDGAPSPDFEAAGQVMMEKRNSPQGCYSAVHESGGVTSRLVINGPLRFLRPDPARCLVGSLETSGPVPVSPHEPAGPLETCISLPVSPQLCSGPLKTNTLVIVSPQLVSGFPESTIPSAGLPLQMLGMAGRMAVTVRHNEATKALKVYFRRRTKAHPLQISQNEETEASIIQTNNTFHSASRLLNQSLSGKEEFLRKISKAADEILPAPKQAMNTSSAPQPSQVAAPRRSRRIAGAGVEFNLQDWGNRSTKKAMRALHILSDDNGTTQEALDAYAKIFKQPLSHNQVEALAALFGWTPPPGLVC